MQLIEVNCCPVTVFEQWDLQQKALKVRKEMLKCQARTYAERKCWLNMCTQG